MEVEAGLKCKISARGIDLAGHPHWRLLTNIGKNPKRWRRWFKPTNKVPSPVATMAALLVVTGMDQ